MAKEKKIKVMSLEEILIPIEEQPYDVPKNWCWTNMSGVAELYTGNSINERVKKEKYLNQTEGLNFIATKDVEFDNSIVYDNGVKINDYDKFKTAPANTSLLCIEGGSAGRKLGFTREKVCFGNKLCAFVDKVCVPKYIYYYLQSNVFYNQFMSQRHGLIGGVSVKELSNIAIPVATLAEQQRIVEQIESLLAKLDEAKEKVENILESFDKRKAALYNMAFSGELTEQWRRNNGIEKDTWISTTMGDISCLITKGASPRWQGVEYTDDKTQTLFVTSENVREGYLDLSKEKYLDNKINEIQKRSVLHYGDVLVNIVGASIGRAAIYSLEKLANTNQAVCIVRLKDMEINDFVCFYLNSPTAQQYYCDNKVETARANISLANISSMPIMIPAESERREIMDKLKYLFEKEDTSKEMLSNLIDNIELMKKSILAKAFRGELGTNNPDEENAVELLKSILVTE